MVNEYTPWVESGETEVAFWKSRFLRESARAEELEEMVVGLLKQGEELSHAQLRVEGFESVRQEWNRISKRQQERIEELERQEKARAETRDELNRAAGLFLDLKKDIDRLFKMNDEERIKTENVEQRLRDMMIEACNRPLDVTVAIAKAAGYVRCKRCDGDGILMMEIGLSGGKRCDCINGWREADDV